MLAWLPLVQVLWVLEMERWVMCHLGPRSSEASKGPLGTALAIVSEYSARVLVHRAAAPARPFAGGRGGRELPFEAGSPVLQIRGQG